MSKISPDRPPKGCLRLLVVDVTAISREGIRAIIKRDGRFQLSEYAHESDSTANLVKEYKPHLLLIEPFTGGRDGVLLIKDLKARFPKLRILAISLKSEEVYAERILRAGACGY